MKKILIVDDIFTNRLLLREIIKKLNLQSIEAQNGKEAIGLLRHEQVDIVFMDIEMPVMNGLETTRYIREHLPAPKCNVPIVAITAHDPTSFMDSYSSVGFTQFMSKPYSIQKLEKLISQFEGSTEQQATQPA